MAGGGLIRLIRGTIMTNTDLVGFAENKSPELESYKSSEPESARNIHKLPFASAGFLQPESSDREMSSEDLNSALDRVSKISIGELDSLIGELQTLRRKLQTDRDRIQRDIAAYSGLTKQVMQITEIITDSVKRLPGGSGISQ
jgi:hypothetical protein